MTTRPSSGNLSIKVLKESRISLISLKKSRWSASTFKITAMLGKKEWKELVYSQASARKMSDCPTRRFPPISFIIPPTVIVGSFAASIRISPIMEVVVVFPWVPATLIAVA